MPYWRGVFPAALTQFGAGGELDRPATMSQLDALIAGGDHGIVLLGRRAASPPTANGSASTA
jgi:dihydrodipicolinate synthase/N-acetylneuraminate lyase